MKFALPVLTVLFAVAASLIVANSRWNRVTQVAIERLERSSHEQPAASNNSARELDELPFPVQRYLRDALGPLIVDAALIEQEGDFLLRPEPNGWRPFVATHHAATQPPGFVWDARIRMAPGLTIRVRDALLNGSGSMHASIAGLRTVAHAAGTPDMAEGALHRYLAEAVWFPTALLPSMGVEWTAIDDSTARATLRSGETQVWLDFYFGEDGLVRRVYTPARARAVDNGSVPTPWQATFSRYERRSGLLIPLEGEVAWLLPDGPQPYWRGRLTKVSLSYSLPPEGVQR
jgi:hypothetical protein